MFDATLSFEEHISNVIFSACRLFGNTTFLNFVVVRKKTLNGFFYKFAINYELFGLNLRLGRNKLNTV